MLTDFQACQEEGFIMDIVWNYQYMMTIKSRGLLLNVINETVHLFLDGSLLPPLGTPLGRVLLGSLTENHIPLCYPLSLHLYTLANGIFSSSFWPSVKASSCPLYYLSLPFHSHQSNQSNVFKCTPTSLYT